MPTAFLGRPSSKNMWVHLLCLRKRANFRSDTGGFCSHNDDYWFCYTATCFFNFDGVVNISGVGIAIGGRVYFTLANKLLCFSIGRISAAIVWCSLINANRHKGSVIIKV
jgi:hypothetical protein